MNGHRRSNRSLQQFENAATKIARNILFPLAGTSEEGTQKASETIPKIQITIKSGLNLLQVRELTANTMNKLVRIPGIVISASVLTARATKLHLQCRGCQISQDYTPTGWSGRYGKWFRQRFTSSL
jgi:DNA replication licensing factor MCM5